MSQMETHIGKLLEVDMKGLSLEEWCKQYCNEHDIKELESYYDAWIEKFSDCFTYCFPDRMQYVIANNKPYQIIENKENYGEDIFNAKKNFDNSINYVVQYYNGGYDFNEAIETALERMKNNRIELNP